MQVHRPALLGSVMRKAGGGEGGGGRLDGSSSYPAGNRRRRCCCHRWRRARVVRSKHPSATGCSRGCSSPPQPPPTVAATGAAVGGPSPCDARRHPRTRPPLWAEQTRWMRRGARSVQQMQRHSGTDRVVAPGASAQHAAGQPSPPTVIPPRPGPTSDREQLPPPLRAGTWTLDRGTSGGGGAMHRGEKGGHGGGEERRSFFFFLVAATHTLPAGSPPSSPPAATATGGVRPPSQRRRRRRRRRRRSPPAASALRAVVSRAVVVGTAGPGRDGPFGVAAGRGCGGGAADIEWLCYGASPTPAASPGSSRQELHKGLAQAQQVRDARGQPRRAFHTALCCIGRPVHVRSAETIVLLPMHREKVVPLPSVYLSMVDMPESEGHAHPVRLTPRRSRSTPSPPHQPQPHRSCPTPLPSPRP